MRLGLDCSMAATQLVAVYRSVVMAPPADVMTRRTRLFQMGRVFSAESDHAPAWNHRLFQLEASPT